MRTNVFKNIFKQHLEFPILSEENGKILLRSGIVTHSYEAIPHDLDQKTEEEIYNCYSNLKSRLRNFSDGDWIKFYRVNDKILISSPNEFSNLPGMKLQRTDSAVDSFFDGDIPFSDIRFYENFLTVNGNYWGLVSLDSAFSESSECMLDRYGEDYVLSFRKVRTEVAKKELQMRRRSQGVATNTLYLNHEGEEAFKQIDNTLNNITTGKEALFRASCWFIVKADSQRELIERTKKLIRNIKNDGGRAFLETYAIDFFFNHCLVGVPPVYYREFPCNSHYLSNLIPYSRDFLHEKGLPLIGYSERGKVFYNFFDEQNSNNNALITGMSGQGKSFFTGALLYDLRKQGVRLGIFDLGGSFHRLAKYLGGELLNLKFNPTQFCNDPQFLFDFFMAVIPQKEFDRQQQGHLMSLFKQIRDEELYFNNMTELLSFLELHIGGIQYYFAEVDDFFTNGSINPPDVFYLDIQGLPKSLVAPYLVFAKKLSDSRVGSEPILNVWDECWDFMNNPIVAEMLTRNVKTGRKENKANIFISQEITEFSNNFGKVASSIIGNTFTKIYFHQPQIDHPSISDAEKYFLPSVQSEKGVYSEFFLSNPNNKKVLKFFASRLIYELVHTERTYLEQQMRFLNEKEPLLGFKKAFEKWVDHVQ